MRLHSLPINLLPLLMVLFFVLPSPAAERPERPFVKPAALKPGDTIALVAPARPIRPEDADFISRGLEAKGYKVKAAPNITTNTRLKYLAGPDQLRADTLMEAFRDPEVDAIFCVTGGYGTSRLLDKLDYGVIRENPKVITGFSDITGLHLALNRHAGLITFHAPTHRFAVTDNRTERPFAAPNFWNLLSAETWEHRPQDEPYTLSTDGITTPMVTLTPGIGQGRLIGGNLSLISATMGTPYEIHTDGCILFIEDVREAPYRVDRMLAQLKLAGKLDKLQGVVVGHFTDAQPDDPHDSFTVEELFDQYFGGRGYPVLLYYPVGHITENSTIPVGVMAELNAEAKTLTLLESPFHTGKPKQ